ncbi:helix-turn-helix transcriptional regulator [Cohnella lupini]|uniref:Putative molybdopterin biosynthesis protein n=1 Tax=Cohnella lupini TaxID=1294267 RepID=A0A3D9IX60_9BACL|nr:helix-turn-helix transcriptional regulator [Cohnella lupini]RED66244.1 putative molybdopterin biosynthesis protein [Cohnella lupini]
MSVSDESYTTEEVAKLLKISKLTVYDLLKKGDLPSYRVGKQMRVDASDLEAFKMRSKGTFASELPLPSSDLMPVRSTIHNGIQQQAAGGERQLVITGQDVSLDILSRYMEGRTQGVRPLRSYTGSMDGLVSMYRGESDIVSSHLWDGDTGEYNLPYIRKLFVGQSYLVVRLLTRSAGMYVRTGNPKGILGWDDLTRPGIRIANRETGSGARVLLDEQMRVRHVDASNLNGYLQEEASHLAVAGKVASHEADVGIGIANAAHLVGNIDFIPLVQEHYDIMMLKRPQNKAWIASVLSIVQSDAFRNELRMIQGYDLALTGRVMFET